MRAVYDEWLIWQVVGGREGREPSSLRIIRRDDKGERSRGDKAPRRAEGREHAGTEPDHVGSRKRCSSRRDSPFPVSVLPHLTSTLCLCRCSFATARQTSRHSLSARNVDHVAERNTTIEQSRCTRNRGPMPRSRPLHTSQTCPPRAESCTICFRCQTIHLLTVSEEGYAPLPASSSAQHRHDTVR